MKTLTLKEKFKGLHEGLKKVFRDRSFEGIKASIFAILSEDPAYLPQGQVVFEIITEIERTLKLQGSDKDFLDIVYLTARGLDAYVKDQACKLNDKITKGLGIPIKLEYSPRKFTDRISAGVDSLLTVKVTEFLKTLRTSVEKIEENKAEHILETLSRKKESVEKLQSEIQEIEEKIKIEDAKEKEKAS